MGIRFKTQPCAAHDADTDQELLREDLEARAAHREVDEVITAAGLIPLKSFTNKPKPMKYIRTALWFTAFLIACMVQLKCVQYVDSTMEKRDARDSAKTQDSIAQNHSELSLDSLHDAQM